MCIYSDSESPLFIGFSELFFVFVGKKWVNKKNKARGVSRALLKRAGALQHIEACLLYVFYCFIRS